MKKQNRDVKFVIYQALYIFVVCVVALKGADLDLTEVINKENVVEKSYADSLKKYIDSLLALGLVPKIDFDTNMKFSNPEELQRQLAETQQRLVQVTSQMPQMTINQTGGPTVTTQQQQQIQQQQQQQEQQPPTPEEQQQQNIDIRISQQFTQFTTNTISNPYNVPLDVVGSDGSTLASIPPNGSRSFQIAGQPSITFKAGNSSRTVQTKPNAKPQLGMQRLAPSGENVSVRTIQSTVGYRITLNDDFPGQIEVNFSGPISVKQVNATTWDITLNFIKSQQQFDNFTDNKDSPYSVAFQVSVKDKVAGHSLVQQGVFQFGEY